MVKKIKTLLTFYYSSLVIRHSSLLFIVYILFSSASCVKYSLSGGDTGSAKTLNIQSFFNEAAGPPNVAQLFTEKLRDYYQQNSKLSLVTQGGDWVLDGRIIGYTVIPVAPTGTGTTGLNRLTISVSVNFTNNMDAPSEVKSFENVIFSFYEDFPQTQSLSQVESELMNTILDRIVFDVFSRTTSNW